MLVAGEVKGELARIHPVRDCCRRAQLAGMLYSDRTGDGSLVTLDRATARIAVHLAASLGVPVAGPVTAGSGAALRRHLRVGLDGHDPAEWRWSDARDCDRRAFLRGTLLGMGSISLGAGGAHVEFVFRSPARANELRRRLAESEIRSAVLLRRGRRVVYIKGQEHVASLLRLTGAHRGLMDLESTRVGRDVRNRLNRLLNAEEANLARTVRAADRQLKAIDRLEEAGVLDRLPLALLETAVERRRRPDADLDALAEALGVSRSAANHRLRRLLLLADEVGNDGGDDEAGPRRTGATG